MRLFEYMLPFRARGCTTDLSHITSSMDLCNTGGRLAGSCTAAIFLKRFVDGLIVDGLDNEQQDGLVRWAHIDIAGTMDLAGSDGGYNLKGMTGR